MVAENRGRKFIHIAALPVETSMKGIFCAPDARAKYSAGLDP
jgi:hypothetical protein